MAKNVPVMYLDNERKRFVRQSGRSKAFRPEGIFPLLDWIAARYGQGKARRFGGLSLSGWPEYSNSIEYVLEYFPKHEVHSYVASQDRKLLLNLYAGLERQVIQIEEKPVIEITKEDRHILNYYDKIRDFVPLVKAQMVICA